MPMIFLCWFQYWVYDRVYYGVDEQHQWLRCRYAWESCVFTVYASASLCWGCGSGVNEAMACPPTRGLCLTSLLVCSHALQWGWTPLHWTANVNAALSAEVLIKHKADIDKGHFDPLETKVDETWWWGRGACAVDCMLAMPHHRHHHLHRYHHLCNHHHLLHHHRRHLLVHAYT